MSRSANFDPGFIGVLQCVPSNASIPGVYGGAPKGIVQQRTSERVSKIFVDVRRLGVRSGVSVEWKSFEENLDLFNTHHLHLSTVLIQYKFAVLWLLLMFLERKARSAPSKARGQQEK
jgi:hypothetical protein